MRLGESLLAVGGWGLLACVSVYGRFLTAGLR